MLCINNISTDPYFNLAAEEYLLKELQDDIFMVWQNQPSVIIGKHQNVYSEVNLDFINTNRICLVRRYTGGGAVYHDSGNLNISFIRRNEIKPEVFTQQLVDFLETLGVKALADRRNNITIDGHKVSGSAQCIHKERLLHHATLLFESNLKDLKTALDANTPTPEKIQAPEKIFVRSIKSPVINICDFIPGFAGITEIKAQIFNFFLQKSHSNTIYSFNSSDIESINHLKNTKYITRQWNFLGSFSR